MPVAEGKKISFKDPSVVTTIELESFPYEGVKQKVIYKTTEFSAVCPFSGLPDIGTVTIEYIPSDKVIELKSLKYYFVSYRDVGIYQEHVTSKIFSDIYGFLKPQHMKLTVVYQTRGGIDTTTEVDSDNL